MKLEEAKEIALTLCRKLQPSTDKLHIAGSVRRQKPEVNDIEIVCLPKQSVGQQGGLWDEGASFYFRSQQFVDTVNGLGKIIKGSPNGKYIQIELPEQVNLDLFIPDECDFQRQYAIRTGSADFVIKNIAAGWKRNGWCGSDKGLRKIRDCQETKTPDGKSKWRCTNPNAQAPPAWETETDFFHWIGVPWIKPNLRT